MENIVQKAYFLRNDYANKLKVLRPDMKGGWGKMNAQQMVEHMADYIRMGRGDDNVSVSVVTPAEHLDKYRSFLSSEKEFRENTPNALMPEIPEAVKQRSMAAAIDNMSHELKLLFKAFEDNPDKIVVNPIFGELDYDMTIQLLYKHAWHHLKQFGIME